MTRQEFPGKVCALAFQRAKGRCENCGIWLRSGNVRFDHLIADGLTGEPTLANCQVLCRNCHATKTKDDVRYIARAKRRERAHIGARTSRNPMPCGKQSPWKKKIDGSVVRR